jgi:hypothetical protein
LLFVHETHEVLGAREDGLEVAFRERWLPALAESDGARLLYFLRDAHGTGASDRVLTRTAWQALAERADRRDLRPRLEARDALRHDDAPGVRDRGCSRPLRTTSGSSW